MAKKYYAVWRGRKVGIFDSWEECRKQISHYSDAGFKSFTTLKAAEQALKKNSDLPVTYCQSDSDKKSHGKNRPILDSIAVDASCTGNPGIMEYRGVYTRTGKEVFREGPFQKGTNNIGEFLAIVQALAYVKKTGIRYPVYSDSSVAIGWVKKKICGTKLHLDEKNEITGRIRAAIKTLHTTPYDNRLLKWDTKQWGEIPADFGRK
jgi:ribonuclease HI